MSDLYRDIEEEDEVRRLLSKPEPGLETPPFGTLSARQRSHGPLMSGAAIAAAALVLVAIAVAPAILRSTPPAATVSPPPGATATPAAVAPGGATADVTPCEEIPTPAYLPRASADTMRAGRSASSQDVVTLGVPDLEVDGQPADLTVTAQAAPFVRGDAGSVRHVGPRMLSLVVTSGLNATPAPPGRAPPIHVRSEVLAVWSEPSAACPYFVASLRSSGTNADALERELLRVIESMPLTPAAPSSVASLVVTEADAWARIREAFPTGPVAEPTWLPPEVDRSRVELRGPRVSPTREYEVVYRDAAGGDILTFRVGPVDAIRESGIGFCCVRGAHAIFEFASHLFSDPLRPGIRRMRWEEQTRTLSFTSERIKGEDMLRIAWSLDRATAPRNPDLNVRAKVGACASSAGPEATIRRLLSLSGSNDRDALLDCYSLDAIGTGGQALASWAELPSTTDVSVQGQGEIAGRALIGASWTFTSDAGGPWGRMPTRFFLLGLEDGVWRIYEVGSAPFSSPP